MKRLFSLVLLSAAVACGDAADGPVVARTSGQVLSVTTLVDFVTARPELPNDVGVIGAITELWLNLSLLGEAASEDSTLTNVDVSRPVDRTIADRLVRELLESNVVPDTAFTDEALRSLFVTEAPGTEVTISHVLFGFPPNATPAQLDSLQSLAQGITDRARAGEDFSELAAEFSQDAQTAEAGGAVGSLSKGSGMVEAFEDAALALAVNEVSDPVETLYGLHVIKVDARTEPDFDDVAAGFRAEMVAQRMVVAESVYVEGIVGPIGLTLAEGAAQIARELAQRPGSNLTRRAGGRTLVTHSKGTYTAADFLGWVQEQPGQLRMEVVAAPDEPLGAFLENLGRYDVLLAEARDSGIEVPQLSVDSIVDAWRGMVVDFATQAGLIGITPLPGESVDDAIATAVSDALSRIVNGEIPMVDLGAISFALRDDGGGRVFEDQFPAVIAAVNRSFGAMPPPAILPIPTGIPPTGTGAPGGGAGGDTTPGTPSGGG